MSDTIEETTEALPQAFPAAIFEIAKAFLGGPPSKLAYSSSSAPITLPVFGLTKCTVTIASRRGLVAFGASGHCSALGANSPWGVQRHPIYGPRSDRARTMVRRHSSRGY